MSKYNTETLYDVRIVLENTGDTKEGIKAAGVTKSTWSKWLKNKPEFAKLVKKARAYWRQNKRESLINRVNHIRDELLSDDGSVTEIVDSQALDKIGTKHDIKTVTRKRAPEWLMKDLLATGEEDKKPTVININFESLEQAVAKKAKAND
jgi:hypothetical protein